MSEVMQIASEDEAMRAVLDHLLADAWSHGSVAISSRLDGEWWMCFIGG